MARTIASTDGKTELKHSNLKLAVFLSLVLVVLTVLRISGSSVGILNEYLYEVPRHDPGLLAGQPRWVRGDEWLVATSGAAAQSEIGFAHFNPNAGLGQEMSLFGDAPTDHWSTIFKPQNWAYFVLPLEHAVAFKWWLRGFCLIFASYILVKELLRGRTAHGEVLAITSAGILFFTPFIQWWYSTSAVELITYFSIVFYTLLRILDRESWLILAILCPLAGYCATASLFTLYPPFLIPLGLLGLFLGAGHVADHRASIPRVRFVVAGAFLAGIALTSIVLLALYYLAFNDIFEAVRNTVYPGHRLESGGGYPILRLFGGAYNFLLLRGGELPGAWLNESEASTTFLVFPWLVPTIFLAAKRGQRWSFSLLSLVAYLSLLMVWLLFGLSGPVEKLLMLDRVPVERGMIGVVFANSLLLASFVAVPGERRLADPRKLAGSTAVVVLLLHLLLGYVLFAIYDDAAVTFLEWWLPAIGAAMLIFALLRGRSTVFLVCLFLYLFSSTVTVNPLYQGLGPLRESPLLAQTMPLRDADPQGRWLIYGSPVYGNYLQANGYPTLNSVQFYPQEELWLTLDPQRQREDAWNRFAHINVGIRSDLNSVGIRSRNIDNITVAINPCNPLLERLNVKFFVSVYRLDGDCLEQIRGASPEGATIYVYRRR